MENTDMITAKRGALQDHLARWEELSTRFSTDPERAMKEVASRIAANNYPVVVGPWLSEVGFELLYWIPFLNWVTDKFGISRDRIMAISRGGVDNWYAGTARSYWETFSRYTAEQFRDKNAERRAVNKTQKQFCVSDFDVEIMNEFLTSQGIDQFEWIHPLCMYYFFDPYWKSAQSLGWVAHHTRYKPIARPTPDPLPGLPETYVAVKFYFSKAFPKTEENRLFILQTLGSLTATENVVLLNTGLSIDDHSELMPKGRKRLFQVDGFMKPENNLRVQSHVISGAKCFYGTYGGFSYLAPFMNVPSVSFYSLENALHMSHVDLAYRACRYLKCGSFDGIKLPPGHVPQGSDFLAMHVRQVDGLKKLAPESGVSAADPIWRRMVRHAKRLAFRGLGGPA
jgi:hypothetical protein